MPQKLNNFFASNLEQFDLLSYYLLKGWCLKFSDSLFSGPNFYITYPDLNEEVTDVLTEARNFLIEGKKSSYKHLDLRTKIILANDLFFNFFFSHLKSFKVFLKKFADVILNVLNIFFDDFGLVHSDPVRIRGLRLIVQWNRYCTIFDTPKILFFLF